MRRTQLLAMMMLLLTMNANSQVRQTTSAAEPQFNAPAEMPESTTPGQHVSLRGQNLGRSDLRLYLRTGDEQKVADVPPGIAVTPKWDDNSKALIFVVPLNAPSKRYLVFAEYGSEGHKKELQVPGELRVQPDTPPPVKLDSVYPGFSYSEIEGKFNFELSGQNFAPNDRDNIIEIVNQGPVRVATPETPCAPNSAAIGYVAPCIDSLTPVTGLETSKLQVTGFHPGPYQGPVSIRVRVGQGSKNVSEAVQVTFSAVSQFGVALAAIGVFAFLLVIFYLLMKKGIGTTTIGGRQFGPRAALFLDRETDSYSLSKFQVLIWTAVTVYAFVYLFLC
ncbi:MAG: hypothetical protein ABSD98_17910, partial [Candidatus Korobacteraceae bacterium]